MFYEVNPQFEGRSLMRDPHVVENEMFAFREIVMAKEKDAEGMQEIALSTAPAWLAIPKKTIIKRIKTFPQGQVVFKAHDPWLKHKDNYYCYYSLNRINWDGDLESLPTRDNTSKLESYVETGNTLVLIDATSQYYYEKYGSGSQTNIQLNKQMFDYVKLLACNLGVKYFIGSFRPNLFGAFRALKKNRHADFDSYCRMLKADGSLFDHRLQFFTQQGVKFLKADQRARTVVMSLVDFLQKYLNGRVPLYKPGDLDDVVEQILELGESSPYYRNAMLLKYTNGDLAQGFNPYSWAYDNPWSQINPIVFDCLEVGQWTVNQAKLLAIYQESALWGMISFK